MLSSDVLRACRKASSQDLQLKRPASFANVASLERTVTVRAASPSISRIASALHASSDFVTCRSQADTMTSRASNTNSWGRKTVSELSPSDSASQIGTFKTAAEMQSQLHAGVMGTTHKRKAASTVGVLRGPSPMQPRAAFIALSESVGSVDMEAEIRARRRRMNASPSPKLADDTAVFHTVAKALPQIPEPKRACAEVHPVPASHARRDDEALPAAGHANLPDAKEDVRAALHHQHMQQENIGRYLTDLNAWLERDHSHRAVEWETFDAGIRKLNEELAQLKAGIPADVQQQQRSMALGDASARANSAKPLMFGNGGQWTNAPWKPDGSAHQDSIEVAKSAGDEAAPLKLRPAKGEKPGNDAILKDSPAAEPVTAAKDALKEQAPAKEEESAKLAAIASGEAVDMSGELLRQENGAD